MDMRRVIRLMLVAGSIAINCRAQLPEGAGKSIVQKACGTCHAAEIVLGRFASRLATVLGVITCGLPVNAATGKPFRGVNTWLLELSALRR